MAEVSWQTAFWTLMPLAISTMTQPCGKVCGLPNRYSTYMRSSPLICLADTLSILIHFTTAAIGLSMTFETSLVILIKERFDKDRESDNAIRNIQQLTWLRYLFFAIGTLPPAIKMIAMQGIPWTKTWAIMYLTSFLATEILVLLSWKRVSTTDVHWPSATQSYTQRDIYRNSLTFGLKNILVRGVYNWALLIHFLVAIGAYLSLIVGQKFIPYTWTYWLYFPTFGFHAMYQIAVLVVAVLHWVTSSYVTDVPATFLGIARLIFTMTILGLSLVPYGWLGGNFNRWLHVWEVVQEAPQQYNFGQMVINLLLYTVRLIPFGVIGMFAWVVLWYACRRVPGFGAQLILNLPSNPRQRSITLKPDPFAIFWFVFFVYSIALTILWYAYKYDSRGTENPVWTGVFG